MTLTKLLELGEKATPGPWQTWSDGGAPLRVIAAKDGAWNGEICKMTRTLDGDDGCWDGEFIAAAKNSLPLLRMYQEAGTWLLAIAEHTENCTLWMNGAGYKETVNRDSPRGCICGLDKIRDSLRAALKGGGK